MIRIRLLRESNTMGLFDRCKKFGASDNQCDGFHFTNVPFFAWSLLQRSPSPNPNVFQLFSCPIF